MQDEHGQIDTGDRDAGGVNTGSIVPNGSGGSVDRNAVTITSESGALISLIERAARDPSVDIDKMERLFQMYERVEQRRAVQAYNAAMAAAQEEMPAVVKNRENNHTKARYADLYAIADECLPIIHKHGFGLSFAECTATAPGCMGISCRASHSGGHAEVYTFNVPVDATGSQGKTNKTQTQAYGSTFTYGRRYATCGVFNIIITDKDGNSSAGDGLVSAEQKSEIEALIRDTEANIGWICERYEISDISQMTTAQFKEAKAGLSARKRAIAEAAKKRSVQ